MCNAYRSARTRILYRAHPQADAGSGSHTADDAGRASHTGPAGQAVTRYTVLDKLVMNHFIFNVGNVVRSMAYLPDKKWAARATAGDIVYPVPTKRFHQFAERDAVRGTDLQAQAQAAEPLRASHAAAQSAAAWVSDNGELTAEEAAAQRATGAAPEDLPADDVRAAAQGAAALSDSEQGACVGLTVAASALLIAAHSAAAAEPAARAADSTLHSLQLSMTDGHSDCVNSVAGGDAHVHPRRCGFARCLSCCRRHRCCRCCAARCCSCRFATRLRSLAHNAWTALRVNFPERARDALRVAIALLLASTFALVPALNQRFVNGLWAAVTVAFVAGPSVGGSLQQSLARVQGTVVGAVAGYMLVVFSNQHPGAIVAGLTLWSLLTGYVRTNPTFGYAGLVSAFTAPIVALGYRRTGEEGEEITLRPVDRFALARIELTLIGATILVLVTNTLWPSRASDQARQHTVQVLRSAADCADALFSTYVAGWTRDAAAHAEDALGVPAPFMRARGESAGAPADAKAGEVAGAVAAAAATAAAAGNGEAGEGKQEEEAAMGVQRTHTYSRTPLLLRAQLPRSWRSTRPASAKGDPDIAAAGHGAGGNERLSVPTTPHSRARVKAAFKRTLTLERAMESRLRAVRQLLLDVQTEPKLWRPPFPALAYGKVTDLQGELLQDLRMMDWSLRRMVATGEMPAIRDSLRDALHDVQLALIASLRGLTDTLQEGLERSSAASVAEWNAAVAAARAAASSADSGAPTPTAADAQSARTDEQDAEDAAEGGTAAPAHRVIVVDLPTSGRSSPRARARAATAPRSPTSSRDRDAAARGGRYSSDLSIVPRLQSATLTLEEPTMESVWLRLGVGKARELWQSLAALQDALRRFERQHQKLIIDQISTHRVPVITNSDVLTFGAFVFATRSIITVTQELAWAIAEVLFSEQPKWPFRPAAEASRS